MLKARLSPHVKKKQHISADGTEHLMAIIPQVAMSGVTPLVPWHVRGSRPKLGPLWSCLQSLSLLAACSDRAHYVISITPRHARPAVSVTPTCI